MTTEIPTMAPLTNVFLLYELTERLRAREKHLPGIGVFNGFSGYGKTYATIYARGKTNGIYVEVGESWTKKTFCEKLAKECGIVPKGLGVSGLVDEIVKSLALSERPLFIDEADKIIHKGFVDIVREIHDKSKTPVILIGEENLPAAVEQNERIHNRVLSFVLAQPVSLEDTAHLAKLFVPKLNISPEVLEAIHKASGGRCRRICVSLSEVEEYAKLNGIIEIKAGELDKIKLSSGRAERRRA